MLPAFYHTTIISVIQESTLGLADVDCTPRQSYESNELFPKTTAERHHHAAHSGHRGRNPDRDGVAPGGHFQPVAHDPETGYTAADSDAGGVRRRYRGPIRIQW